MSRKNTKRLHEQLKAHTDRQTISRSRHYALGENIELVGYCRGTWHYQVEGNYVYNVFLTTDSVSCDCPAPSTCKHELAVARDHTYEETQNDADPLAGFTGDPSALLRRMLTDPSFDVETVRLYVSPDAFANRCAELFAGKPSAKTIARIKRCSYCDDECDWCDYCPRGNEPGPWEELLDFQVLRLVDMVDMACQQQEWDTAETIMAAIEQGLSGPPRSNYCKRKNHTLAAEMSRGTVNAIATVQVALLCQRPTPTTGADVGQALTSWLRWGTHPRFKTVFAVLDKFRPEWHDETISTIAAALNDGEHKPDDLAAARHALFEVSLDPHHISEVSPYWSASELRTVTKPLLDQGCDEQALSMLSRYGGGSLSDDYAIVYIETLHRSGRTEAALDLARRHAPHTRTPELLYIKWRDLCTADGTWPQHRAEAFTWLARNPSRLLRMLLAAKRVEEAWQTLAEVAAAPPYTFSIEVNLELKREIAAAYQQVNPAAARDYIIAQADEAFAAKGFRNQEGADWVNMLDPYDPAAQMYADALRTRLSRRPRALQVLYETAPWAA